jgi:hypothetical protein
MAGRAKSIFGAVVPASDGEILNRDQTEEWKGGCSSYSSTITTMPKKSTIPSVL